jgi:hypothetical protein
MKLAPEIGMEHAKANSNNYLAADYFIHKTQSNVKQAHSVYLPDLSSNAHYEKSVLIIIR